MGCSFLLISCSISLRCFSYDFPPYLSLSVFLGAFFFVLGRSLWWSSENISRNRADLLCAASSQKLFAEVTNRVQDVIKRSSFGSCVRPSHDHSICNKMFAGCPVRVRLLSVTEKAPLWELPIMRLFVPRNWMLNSENKGLIIITYLCMWIFFYLNLFIANANWYFICYWIIISSAIF